jgi:hypothetical protein
MPRLWISVMLPHALLCSSFTRCSFIRFDPFESKQVHYLYEAVLRAVRYDYDPSTWTILLRRSISNIRPNQVLLCTHNLNLNEIPSFLAMMIRT